MSRVGLERSKKGPRPVHESAGPAYNIPSVFDTDNRIFSSPTRAGHLQTREWLNYRSDVEACRNPGPGAFRHSTADRTGRWDAPIERLTSGLPQSQACQGGYAYTMGFYIYTYITCTPHGSGLSRTRLKGDRWSFFICAALL